MCVLCIDPRIIEHAAFAFSDGNVGAAHTRIYHDLAEFRKVDFEAVLAPLWDATDEGKRRKAAELLIKGTVPASFISKIVSRSRDDQRIGKAMEKYQELRWEREAREFWRIRY